MMTTDEATLKKEIADFYDGASGMWEKIWGDHMHQGFYEPNSAPSSANHRLAQIRMIEECLRFAGYSGSFALLFPIFVSLWLKWWRMMLVICVC